MVTATRHDQSETPTEAGCCDRAAAYCRGRAAAAWGEAERERWRRLAERNEQSADRLRRTDGPR